VIRVANAPVSYGAFELTVGVLPNVPAAERVLDAIAAAGYAGTELGPPGYLGDPALLRGRLEERSLELAGAFVPIRFGEEDPAPALEAALAHGAKPVLADAGPRRNGGVSWPRIADGVNRAADLARSRGLEPTFHHHMGTRVQTPSEIERLLELTDVSLLLDTGHLAAGGGEPVQGLRDWRERVDHVHVKDVRRDLLGGRWQDAWRAGLFCELGTGGVDLEGFFAELRGYSGWLVVEQDWVPGPDEDASGAIAAQERNRRWLAEHAGL
jgi:inosose dehydratase